MLRSRRGASPARVPRRSNTGSGAPRLRLPPSPVTNRPALASAGGSATVDGLDRSPVRFAVPGLASGFPPTAASQLGSLPSASTAKRGTAPSPPPPSSSSRFKRGGPAEGNGDSGTPPIAVRASLRDTREALDEAAANAAKVQFEGSVKRRWSVTEGTTLEPLQTGGGSGGGSGGGAGDNAGLVDALLGRVSGYLSPQNHLSRKLGGPRGRASKRSQASPKGRPARRNMFAPTASPEYHYRKPRRLS